MSVFTRLRSGSGEPAFANAACRAFFNILRTGVSTEARLTCWLATKDCRQLIDRLRER